MSKIIKPKEFLRRQKDFAPKTIDLNSYIEITELEITIPVLKALQPATFYNVLKKAVSEFNAAAALNDNSYIDFDDLYTKYSEYMEAIINFVQQSD